MTLKRQKSRRRTTRRTTRKVGKIILDLNRKTLIAFAILFSLPFLVGVAACQPGTPAGDTKTLIDAHERTGNKIAEGGRKIDEWKSELARGWSEADARRKRSKAPQRQETPFRVSECDWAEFGPCDAPPPPEWFFQRSENNRVEGE